MSCAVRSESKEALAALVHDLRQPLGTLEYSVSYLRLLLGETQGAVQQQLCVMQQQMDMAVRLVNDAAAQIAQSAIQRAAGESLDLTKSETAAVT